MQTVKKGDKGTAVLTLQKLLNKAGYNVVEDSDFGQNTLNAVVAFQKAHADVCGKADGVVGEKTWKALGLTESNSKCVDPSVEYMPINVHITKSPNRTIKYLIIHYTAGKSSVKGCVKAIKRVFETRSASADFAVDDATMAQYNPDLKNYYTWAVSGGNGITNKNSISIEICSSLSPNTDYRTPNHEGWYFTEAALNNAEKLAKILMAKYNIPLERVVRHYDVTGKLCPGLIGWNDGKIYTTDGKATNVKNNSTKWLAFKWRLR